MDRGGWSSGFGRKPGPTSLLLHTWAVLVQDLPVVEVTYDSFPIRIGLEHSLQAAAT